MNETYDGSQAKSVAIPARPTDKEMFLAAHPVGSYYWSSTATSPASLFGGTWTQITDRFVLAAGSTYAVNATGGAATHSHGVGSYMAYWAQSGGIVIYRYATGSTWAGQWYLWPGDGMTQGATSGTRSEYLTLTGTSAAANNLPPYIVAYCWRRTA